MKRLHVHVGVADLSTSIRFYSTLFWAEPTVTKDDYAKWMLEDPRVNFAISSGNHAAKGIEHLGIQVESGEELTEVYDRLKEATEPSPAIEPGIPEGIRRSQEAFFRDLPELLKDRKLHGKWVAYHGDEPVKVGRTQTDVIRECNRRGLHREEYDVFVIEPRSPEPEEVDAPSSWYDV